MQRIFADFAFGPGPRTGCWWDETVLAPDWPVLEGERAVDVGIVGGGFTGLSAALHLAEGGASVAVLEAESPGWGASGRNGGFCCEGGAKTDDASLTRRFGAEAAASYWQAERDAVALVADLLDRHGITADTHSRGETQLAHRPKDMERLRRRADQIARGGGPDPLLIEAADLPAHGMKGPFHGALTNPVGFGLNPRKYLFGLARAAEAAGARLFQKSAATALRREGSGWVAETARGRLRCASLVIATNGYSSEDLPGWMAGRYLPSQSNVLVTRPLTEAELAAQGWTSDQACYDTRNLLHYFRLMPDRRFLFGMRGGLISSPGAEARARAATRRDFERMFPAWAAVPSPHTWSGMVCLARDRLPFAGAVPEHPGLFAGFAYHGNGVAMGSYAGRALARRILTGSDAQTPVPMRAPPRRFPLGRARRLLMAPLYATLALRDL